MNPTHLGAFVWLRYRLFVNQIAKGGLTNKIFLAIGAFSIVFSVIAFSIGSFLVGWLATGSVSPPIMMLIWDGIVLVFSFTWFIGLLSELQRSEALSIEKFLHLPVSVAGVFGLNYLSSLLSLNLILFAPAMIGFCLGLSFAHGPAMLLVLPLIVTHLLMVTALTYQFQGWIASLMVDQRRRRTVIMIITVVFIIVCQLPNLINVFRPWENLKENHSVAIAEKQIENRRARDAGEITLEEFEERQRTVLRDQKARTENSNQQAMEQVDTYATLFNTVLPIGWLPLGVRGALEGNVLAALFGTLGYSLIGTVSLWRAYRTTLRMYTGQSSPGVVKTETPTSDQTAAPTVTMLDRRLPCVSEQATAIAFAGFRSLTRAPEAKMLMLTPLLLLMVLGGLYYRIPDVIPEFARPMIAFGAMSFILIMLTQWVGNQFGFDRSGFRVFVLSPAPRREILLGKNLAVAPVAWTLCVLTICAVNILFPMRIDHFLALFPQMISMYLIFCTLANFLSIYAPMPMAAGTMKPVNTKMVPALLNMLFMAMFSLAIGPTMLPLGIEAGVEALEWTSGVPIFLPLAILECGVVIWLYRLALRWQGDLLQAREQAILETVTTKAE